MNPTPLFHEDGRPAKVWYCGQCRYVSKTEEQAEQCCRPRVCTCGAECRTGWTSCDTCRSAKEKERLMERVKSAKKVPEAEWEGPVWPDGSGDGFDSVDSMRDYYDAEGEEVPCPVWGTTPLKLRLDATSILEHATEEMYESAFDHVSDDDLRKLQDVLDEWAKEYGPPDGYEEDNSIVVVLEGDTDEPT